MIRIAIDAMGGDHGPRTVVQGALAAVRDLPLGLLLVGPLDELERELATFGDVGSLDIRMAHAAETVGMAEAPSAALRRKPGASIRVAAEAVARGDAAALVTAGNTGAAVMAAHAAFGMIDGVDRPALATAVPTRTGAAVLVDVGANVECRPQHLVQFAVMGSVYARLALGVERPRVGLLSIGEEETKGNELTREAHRLLKEAGLGFIGNVEARAVYSGSADVIVCDGFTGNIVLKTSEGLVEMMAGLFDDEVGGSKPSEASQQVRRGLRRLRRRLDYSEYGGAPLVGVAGLTIVAHGRSSARAVRNAVAMAYRFASGDFVRRVQEEIAAAGVPHH
jgi:glycerol-3-phosphate acyltransferase PlsX